MRLAPALLAVVMGGAVAAASPTAYDGRMCRSYEPSGCRVACFLGDTVKLPPISRSRFVRPMILKLSSFGRQRTISRRGAGWCGSSTRHRYTPCLR